MIDWWGPVIYEYYASTEGSGATFINSEQALSHPGSVGRDGVMGIVHICDDAGRDLPGRRDRYRVLGAGDFAVPVPTMIPRKRLPRSIRIIRRGRRVEISGYIDSERFLYLTDRAAFTIISGGVNIYPQESENILTLHPKVFDVAVIGVPDEEMGEQVKAVVQLAEGIEPGAHVAEELPGIRSQSGRTFQSSEKH